MSEEELNESIEYNLEYMEAIQSEEIFGGDYTSSVELKYANKTIDRLQQENKQLKHIIDELEQWLEKTLNELKQNDIYDRTSYEMGQIDILHEVSDKIEELKGNKQNN